MNTMVIERICDKEIWRVTCPLSSRSETVRDAAVVRAGISQRLNALEHIVLLTHGFIVLAISTKEVEVCEWSKFKCLEQYPDGHIVQIVGDEITGVDIMPFALRGTGSEGSQKMISLVMAQLCGKTGNDGISIFMSFLAETQYTHLGKVLHVYAGKKEYLTHLTINPGERNEIGKVKIHIFTDVCAPSLTGKQNPVAPGAEIVICFGKIACRFTLIDKLECDAL